MLLGRPGSLIHEGDSRLNYAEMKKMGMKHAPSSYNYEITKMGMRKPSPPIDEIRYVTNVVKFHVLSFSWDMDRAEEG